MQLNVNVMHKYGREAGVIRLQNFYLGRWMFSFML